MLWSFLTEEPSSSRIAQGNKRLVVISLMGKHQECSIVFFQELPDNNVTVFPSQSAFIILCWYRPPTSDNDKETFEALTNLLSRLDAEGKEVYLMGDTSCDFKKPKEGPARQLHSIYNEFQFEQQIKEPTRVASVVNEDGSTRVTKTLIDHMATNHSSYILSAEVLKIGMTDHYLPFIQRRIDAKRLLNKRTKFIETRSLANYQKDLFLSDLASIDWDLAFEAAAGDPNIMVRSFNDPFGSFLEVHAPLKRRRVSSNNTPWISLILYVTLCYITLHYDTL